MVLVLFLPNSYSQDYRQMNLPDGAVARLGKGFIQGIQYSPNGARLAVFSTIGVWLYDTASYREVALIATDIDRIHSVVFSPDSRTLASEDPDGIQFWDTETGENRGTLTEHTGSIASVAFSPDGTTVASVIEGNAVGLWDTETWELKHTLVAHTDKISGIMPSARTVRPLPVGVRTTRCGCGIPRRGN